MAAPEPRHLLPQLLDSVFPWKNLMSLPGRSLFAVMAINNLWTTTSASSAKLSSDYRQLRWRRRVWIPVNWNVEFILRYDPCRRLELEWSNYSGWWFWWLLVGLNQERQITIANKTGNIFSIRICFADDFNFPRVVLWRRTRSGGMSVAGKSRRKNMYIAEEEDLTSSWA